MDARFLHLMALIFKMLNYATLLCPTSLISEDYRRQKKKVHNTVDLMYIFCNCWWYLILRAFYNIIFLCYSLFIIWFLFIYLWYTKEMEGYFFEKYLATVFQKGQGSLLSRLKFSNTRWRSSIISNLHFSRSFILLYLVLNILIVFACS